MSDLTFPAARFRAADATDAEIAVLQGIFDRSDLSVQRQISEGFAQVADGDLRDYLAAKRADGTFDAQPAEAAAQDTGETGDGSADVDDKGTTQLQE